MFANDLLQSQLSLGAYSGAMNPYTASLQTANPFAGVAQSWAVSPFSQQGYGQQGYGGIPNYLAQQQQLQQQLQQLQQLQQIQQLQALASILSSQGANPLMLGQINPWQMQLQPNVLQNPLLNPILAQQLAQLQNPFAQQNPFTQSPFQLAPQSWVGPQIYPHHLQQLTGRGIY